MEKKTIKLKAGEFFSFTDEILSHDVIFLNGARGSGKSYPTAKFVGSELIKDPFSKFFYVRMGESELATYYSWCKDIDLLSVMGGEADVKRGKPGKGDITAFLKCGSMERTIGKCISLESSHLFKSGKYDEFSCMIFEEYARANMSPTAEKKYVFNFLENVVSAFRNRPKKIFLICNNLRSIPLLNQAVEELTGELFVNPIQIKIFREGNKTNKFMAYLNGELYDDEEFSAPSEQWIPLFANKQLVIYQHPIYSSKYLVKENKSKIAVRHHSHDFLTLKFFCQTSASNQFYYDTTTTENYFTTNYQKIIDSIVTYTIQHGGSLISRL